jgi:hypothetical protein
MSARCSAGEPRGTVRDALTHFDECGIVVLSDGLNCSVLLRDFRWKAACSSSVVPKSKRCMRFVIFGHATYEQLLKPFRGLTAKAALYEIDDEWLATDTGGAECYGRCHFFGKNCKSGQFTRPRDFQPLPLLGIPGVAPDSENPAYYDDTWQFRPGRRGRWQLSSGGAAGPGSRRDFRCDGR